jgi:hypothetical protein
MLASLSAMDAWMKARWASLSFIDAWMKLTCASTSVRDARMNPRLASRSLVDARIKPRRALRSVTDARAHLWAKPMRRLGPRKPRIFCVLRVSAALVTGMRTMTSAES